MKFKIVTHAVVKELDNIKNNCTQQQVKEQNLKIKDKPNTCPIDYRIFIRAFALLNKLNLSGLTSEIWFYDNEIDIVSNAINAYHIFCNRNNEYKE